MSNLSNKAKAIEIQNSERIVFVPKFGCYVSIVPTGKVFTVEIFPFEKMFLLDSPCCLLSCSGCENDTSDERQFQSFCNNKHRYDENKS